jgi:hypothetical protein
LLGHQEKHVYVLTISIPFNSILIIFLDLQD